MPVFHTTLHTFLGKQEIVNSFQDDARKDSSWGQILFPMISYLANPTKPTRKWFGKISINEFLIQRSVGGKYYPLSAIIFGRIAENSINGTKIRITIIANPFIVFALLFMISSIILDFLNEKPIETDSFAIMIVLFGYSIFDIFLAYDAIKSQLKIF